MRMAAGTIAAGQSVNLVLTYDITQNTFQTVLQAAVLITTSGRPAAKVGCSQVSHDPHHCHLWHC